MIAAIREDWGEARANYDEFRFFTGLRPSEQIALTMSDFDAERGTLRVNKARVAGIDRATTKTGMHRIFELCPRAVTVLRRQLALRERFEREGRIRHPYIFFADDGSPLFSIKEPGRRWAKSLARLPIRPRRPYCAPFLRQLEPHARQEPTVGGAAARAYRADYARGLRRVGRWRRRIRRVGDSALNGTFRKQ